MEETEAHAILLYYAYIELDATTEHAWHDSLARSLGLGGRLRISSQGLNGTLSGRETLLKEYSRAVTARHGEHGARIDWKFGVAELHQLFPELSCRIVSEVVSLGVDPLQAPLQLAGRHLNPAEFHEELQRAAASDVRNVVLLDARNVYETRIGRFAAANVPTLLPQIRQFSDLPAWIDAHVDELRGRRVLMYCTGGVRCETASAYLRHKLGLAEVEGDADASTDQARTNVLQLGGGIERYIEAFPAGGFWRGSNLVFDPRLRTAPAARATNDVIGTCQQCAAPTDDYAPQRRCTHCRLLLLLCPTCCACDSATLCCEPCARAREETGRPMGPMGAVLEKTTTGALPQRANRRQRSVGSAPQNLLSARNASAGGTDDRHGGDGDEEHKNGAECAVDAIDEPALLTGLEAWACSDAPCQYEHLEHTADVQIHSWGVCLEEAFAQQVLGIMSLITELPTVRVSEERAPGARWPSCARQVSSEGHDLPSLLFNFLDEWLCQFNVELFVCRRLKVLSLDRENWAIESVGVGETFELGRHPQGLEVKAITYSAMRITEVDRRADVLVIVDV